jgi:elongation factor P
MATSNDLKNGMILKIDNNLWKVIEFQHVKPGKGGAFVRTKLKNVIAGKVVDKTFNAGVRVENVNVDRRDMQYLYKENDNYIFMDDKTYEQISVNENIMSDAKNFLIEGTSVSVAMYENNPIYIDMPASVVLKVSQTEPGLQGNRSNAGNKPAVLETGYNANIPLFINEGDSNKIDTRTGEYISKA